MAFYKNGTTVGSKLKFKYFILVIHWLTLVYAKHFQCSIQIPRVVTLNFTFIQFGGLHLSLNFPRFLFFFSLLSLKLYVHFPGDLSKVVLIHTGQCDQATAAFSLSLEKLDVSSLEVFKTWLDEAWNNVG